MVRITRQAAGYFPQQARYHARTRRHTKAQPHITTEIWHLVDQLLCEQWSSEQIRAQLSDQDSQS